MRNRVFRAVDRHFGIDYQRRAKPRIQLLNALIARSLFAERDLQRRFRRRGQTDGRRAASIERRAHAAMDQRLHAHILPAQQQANAV